MYFQKTQTLQQADALEITPQHVQELGNKSGARLLLCTSEIIYRVSAYPSHSFLTFIINL